MPRAKKTLTGAKAAPATPPVGVPYGEGERALESQRRMPVPDFAETGGSAPTTGGTGSGASAGAAPPADRFAQAIEAARAMAPSDSLLAQPTQRPNESVLAGTMPTVTPERPEFNEALFDLRALARLYLEYKGLARLVALAEEQA